MALDLDALLDPAHTAVLTMEMQRGVIGDLTRIADLAAEVERAGVIPATASLCAAARSSSIPVVHCTAEFRADLRGTPRNAPLLAVMTKDPSHVLVGSAGAEVVAELGPDPADVVCARRHGVSPFTGTTLDATLRAFGTKTVVATGVSLNLALVGLAIEAVNLGYSVVVATDCVAGTPREYADSVLHGTIALLATLLPSADIAARWG